MTDMTFETPHALDAAWPARAARSRDARLAAYRREYCAYFVVVLILPLALAVWALGALRTLSLPERGPLRAAWSQAAITTSVILSV